LNLLSRTDQRLVNTTSNGMKNTSFKQTSETVSAKCQITQIIAQLSSRQLSRQQQMPNAHTSWDCAMKIWCIFVLSLKKQNYINTPQSEQRQCCRPTQSRLDLTSASEDPTLPPSLHLQPMQRVPLARNKQTTATSNLLSIKVRTVRVLLHLGLTVSTQPSYCTINTHVFSLILYSALTTAIAVSRHSNHAPV